MSTSLIKTSAGSIVTAQQLSESSKYTLLSYWHNPQTGMDNETVFNINADSMVPTFASLEAPARRNLLVEWTDERQFLGYDRFSGEIGGGRIYIKTEKGIVIKGPIAGGPSRTRRFDGAGAWVRG